MPGARSRLDSGDWIAERLRGLARIDVLMYRVAISQSEDVSRETMKECPTVAEALMLERIWGTPRYPTATEAEAAWERGEW